MFGFIIADCLRVFSFCCCFCFSEFRVSCLLMFVFIVSLPFFSFVSEMCACLFVFVVAFCVPGFLLCFAFSFVSSAPL